MTALEYINRMKLKNENLKYFMVKLYGESDFSALAILFMLAWFHSRNAGYLIGGSKPIAERMEKRYTSLGGKVSFGKRVDSILVDNDKAYGVKLVDGTIIEADYVVSAADGYSTIFKMLEGKYVSDKVKDAYDNWALFTPLVQVSFGINKVLKTEYNATAYFDSGRKIGSTELRQGYSLMNHSAFDPTMAPEGKTTILLRFESPWENWENIGKEEYKAEKEKIKKDSLAILEEIFPGVSDNIEVIDIATPKTDVKYTGVYKGAYEGFMPSGDVTRSLDMELPGLSGFYMVGQWLFPGGGLPPSAQSGNWVIQKICKKEKMKFRIK